LPIIIKNLSIEFPQNSKIAVVGRTGSGKSSLLLAFLKMNEIVSGSIHIGTQNLNELSPKMTRTLISYIPQEPFLFKGALRDNLDPFKE